MSPIFGKDDKKPEGIPLTCCRARDFVAISPAFSPTSTGRGEQTGGLYMCCHCGQPHGIGESGPYDPHPDTLPPHLAMIEHQRSMEARRAGERNTSVRDMRNHPPPKARQRPVVADD